MEAKKDDVINAKLKNIENLQETLQKTLVNTTTSLSKIDELKSELEKSVKSVDEKQKEMEGTKQELQAAVSKIEEVGNKMIEKQSMLKEKEVEALSKVSLYRVSIE
jgi:predicted  nucleic acid-binding Zn-ribbon protein